MALAAAIAAAPSPAQRLVDGRRRRLLDDLLVAALDRALPLEQMHHVAVGVAEDLHLDVPRGVEVALEEHGAVAEAAAASRRRWPPRSAAPASLRTTRMPRPPPPNAALTSTGKPICSAADGARPAASAGSGSARGVDRSTGPRRAARARPAAGHQLLGRDLGAHGLDGLRRGPDEDQTGRRAGPGEAGVLGQEAVAGVEASAPGPPGRGDDGVGAGSVSAGAAPGRRTASSASRTKGAPASGSENTATVAMSMARAVRNIRGAISPRLAISSLLMDGIARLTSGRRRSRGGPRPCRNGPPTARCRARSGCPGGR